MLRIFCHTFRRLQLDSLTVWLYETMLLNLWTMNGGGGGGGGGKAALDPALHVLRNDKQRYEPAKWQLSQKKILPFIM